MWNLFLVWAIAALTPAFAMAEYTKINSKSQFVALVQGKTLTRPLVKLNVWPSGQISGRGASWDVEGNWTWQNGYFCRDLFWGGDALGYNCQEVGRTKGRVRFSSDQGRGASADFRLR
ncbi:MAG TPA: dihydrodipicolinate reductase [Aliiroseovarius sp.]|nr:dihydrodipicolinate reductase [Aliiroseovarius sp.]